MKVIMLLGRVDIAMANAFDRVGSMITVRCKGARRPAGCMCPGGNGVAFDWTLLTDKDGVQFMLSALP